MIDRKIHLVRWGALLLLVTLLAGLGPAQIGAQSDARYFPETGHFLGGSFRAFWENNGGVAIFGFPITEEYVASNGRITQWFERSRFELANVNGQTTVQLALIGVEYTQGRIFPKVPPIQNTADRRYIPETEHIIQYGFKTIWETFGAERIFGYPISEEIDEQLESGRWHTVQYFERARFEYWPEFPPGQRVLISNLGRALVPPELTTPVAPGGDQPQQPAPAPEGEPGIPQSVNAEVIPESGPAGTTFGFNAVGFNANEEVGLWLTAPDQSTFGADFQVRANDEGSLIDEGIAITTDESFPNGIWSFNAQGIESGRQAIGYFRITGGGGGGGTNTPPAPTGDPNRLGVIIHDQLLPQGDAIILPIAGPTGSVFEMFAGGYSSSEEVSAWVTLPNGESVAIPSEFTSLSEEGTFDAIIFSDGFGNADYTSVAQGQASGVTGVTPFRITPNYIAGPGTPRPSNVNGSATPAEGSPGTVFQIRGQSLQPNEQLEFWFTTPNGYYVYFPSEIFADSQGRIGYNPELNLETNSDLIPGVYGFHFRGFSSGSRVSVYFTFSNVSARSLMEEQRTQPVMEQGVGPQIERWLGPASPVVTE